MPFFSSACYHLVFGSIPLRCVGVLNMVAEEQTCYQVGELHLDTAVPHRHFRYADLDVLVARLFSGLCLLPPVTQSKEILQRVWSTLRKSRLLLADPQLQHCSTSEQSNR